MLGTIIGGAAGALGGLFGGLGKNAAIREQLRMLESRKRQNQDWYDRRYNEDATQRADAQRLLTMTEEAIKKRNRAAAGTAAVMGGTDESVAAEKEANAKALADTTSQIAAAADQRKDAIEQQYLSKKDALNAQEAQLKGQKVDGWGMVGNILGGAGNGASLGLNADYILSELKDKKTGTD